MNLFMGWGLVLLSLFNLGSMWIVYRDRQKIRTEVPWLLYLYSLVATELSWLWFPTQVLVSVVLIFGGALQTVMGMVAMLVLIISWVPLLKNIFNAMDSVEVTEQALRKGLDHDYLQLIPEERQPYIEINTPFRDWCNPLQMSRPEVERISDVSYGPLGVKHRLDIYRPIDMPEEGCPVLLQIHGGGWMVGSKEHQALPLMNYLASKGWICVSINYRLSPSVGFPTHLEDCKRALCWIRTEGKKYGMNPDFVAVTGGSAGGHLAALVGLTANFSELQSEQPDVDTRVQAVIPFYGVYDALERHDPDSDGLLARFMVHRVLFEKPDENPELWNLASPVTLIAQDAPSFMIVQGYLDSLTTVTGAQIFKQKLTEVSDNPVVYLELPGAEHAFDGVHSPRTDAVIKGVHRFLEWERARHSLLK